MVNEWLATNTPKVCKTREPRTTRKRTNVSSVRYAVTNNQKVGLDIQPRFIAKYRSK